jgi:hypothetical protein
MKKYLPELSRGEDLRASNNSFSLLLAIAASSVFLWRTWNKRTPMQPSLNINKTNQLQSLVNTRY